MITAGSCAGVTCCTHKHGVSSSANSLTQLLNPTQQKHPIVAGLSMFFVLPKVLGPARWERQILCGLGSLDVCGKLFAAIEVPVLSEALAKHQCWDLVLLLFVTLMQADLVQSECKEFQLFSHY